MARAHGRGSVRQLILALVAGLVMLGALALMATDLPRTVIRRTAATDPPGAAVATSSTVGPAPTNSRVAGADRVATAIAVSQRVWPKTAPAVVIASAQAFPDALAAAPLAGKLGGPVLLVGTVPDERVTAEVRRLAVSFAVLVGGASAVTRAVEADLRAAGVRLRRIAGADRFATAAAVAREVGNASGEVVLASGASFADALSAGPLAAKGRVPVLLTARDELPSASAQAIDALAPRQILVVGGPAVISEAVTSRLRVPVTRLAGEDRYATSVAVAQASLARGLSSQHLYVATGRSFPDALAAGPAAAQSGSALLLIDGSNARLPPVTSLFLDYQKGTMEDVVVIGGLASVSDMAARLVAGEAS